MSAPSFTVFRYNSAHEAGVADRLALSARQPSNILLSLRRTPRFVSRVVVVSNKFYLVFKPLICFRLQYRPVLNDGVHPHSVIIMRQSRLTRTGP